MVGSLRVVAEENDAFGMLLVVEWAGQSVGLNKASNRKSATVNERHRRSDFCE